MSLAISASRGIHQPMKLSSLELPYPKPSPNVLSLADKDSSIDDEAKLLSVSWNQDYGCFAAGTTCGFRIYNCDPFKETFRRDLRGGGFGIVEMLFRSNFLALVGGGENAQYAPNKVLLWDDHQSRCFGEFQFRSTVYAVKLREDHIVVVLECRIYVYNLLNLKLLHQIETLANPRGLCCLSHSSSTSVLACPGLRQGQIRVEHFTLKVTKIITAHDSAIAYFTLTLDGLLLATASIKGTLIRIFNAMDGTRLQEVRRGAERAEIYSIAFSRSVQWMAVSSDKGTIHIFNLRVRVGGEDASNTSSQRSEIVGQNSSSTIDAIVSANRGSNTSSSFSFMKGVLPKYFSSEWSFAQFHLPEVTRYVAGFGAHNTVLIIGLDGSFYRCSFDPVNGGTMVQKEYVRFLKAETHGTST